MGVAILFFTFLVDEGFAAFGEEDDRGCGKVWFVQGSDGVGGLGRGSRCWREEGYRDFYHCSGTCDI